MTLLPSRHLDASVFCRLPEEVFQNLLTGFPRDWLVYTPGTQVLSWDPSRSAQRNALSPSCLPLSWLMLCSGGAHIPQWFLGKVSWDVNFFDTAPLNMSVPSSSSSSRCRTPSWKLFSSGKLEGIALSPSGFQYRCEAKEAVLILYFFSVWNLGEPSLSSQGNDISR